MTRTGSKRTGGRRTLWLAGAGAIILASALYFAWPPGWKASPGDPPDVPGDAGGGGAQATDAQPAEAPASGVVPSDVIVVEESAESAPTALWQIVDESTVTELPVYREVVEGRVLIQITDAAGGWSVGQRIAVPIPQLDETYTPVVERIVPGPSGVRSHVGTLTEDSGHAYRFTITTGPRNTFAHLSTPHGTYELVATGELGWMMPTVNMDRHVDYSIPDYVIPEEEGLISHDP